jgi:hypothetical protein
MQKIKKFPGERTTKGSFTAMLPEVGDQEEDEHHCKR